MGRLYLTPGDPLDPARGALAATLASLFLWGVLYALGRAVWRLLS